MSERFATPFDQPDPDAVARSDRFIDALANSEPVDGDTALAGLLGDWRDELRVPASGGVCPERDAVAALGRGLAARRRARGRAALVSAMAATVLSVAGFGALMGQSKPGDPLYGVRTTLFGEPASVQRRAARGVGRDRPGPGRTNDRDGPVGSGPRQAGRGRRPRADRQGRDRKQRLTRSHEPVEREGGESRPACHGAARCGRNRVHAQPFGRLKDQRGRPGQRRPWNPSVSEVASLSDASAYPRQ